MNAVLEFGKIPVFPGPMSAEGGEVCLNAPQVGDHHHAGISARELYAAMAMQALTTGNWPQVQAHPQHVARDAVRLADALLAELHDCVERAPSSDVTQERLAQARADGFLAARKAAAKIVLDYTDGDSSFDSTIAEMADKIEHLVGGR